MAPRKKAAKKKPEAEPKADETVEPVEDAAAVAEDPQPEPEAEPAKPKAKSGDVVAEGIVRQYASFSRGSGRLVLMGDGMRSVVECAHDQPLKVTVTVA